MVNHTAVAAELAEEKGDHGGGHGGGHGEPAASAVSFIQLKVQLHEIFNHFVFHQSNLSGGGCDYVMFVISIVSTTPGVPTV